MGQCLRLGARRAGIDGSALPVATPSRKSRARPTATNAAAAFTSTMSRCGPSRAVQNLTGNGQVPLPIAARQILRPRCPHAEIVRRERPPGNLSVRDFESQRRDRWW